ncbi:hypothetical protein VspSTUT11_30430 [Vibrio sp. STUT-A11]|nr:hypothetical protein VspSTUT11_30430 [Vibrio sp. STUT-A11]
MTNRRAQLNNLPDSAGSNALNELNDRRSVEVVTDLYDRVIALDIEGSSIG